jgi:hypothetical protein
VAGEIVIVIPVVGSVHDEDEEVVEVVDVVVVQLMAVLGAAALWHETSPMAPMRNARIGRRLTAPLSLTPQMPNHCSSAAMSFQKSANYISSCLPKSLAPFGAAIPNGWGNFNNQTHSSAQSRRTAHHH